MKSRITIIVILVVTLITAGSLYFWKFHYGLSSETNDWIAFGNYISGIATLLNVLVFVWLTYEINNLDNRERKRDRETQQIMIKTQMRHDELKWLISQLNQVSECEPSIFKYGKLSNISLIINSFLHSRKKLFPILNEEDVQHHFHDVCNLLNEMSNLHRKAAGCDENGLPECPPNFTLTDDFKTLLKKFHDKRNTVIDLMENYIIDNLHTSHSIKDR